jgi:hypothetical protein
MPSPLMYSRSMRFSSTPDQRSIDLSISNIALSFYLLPYHYLFASREDG